MTIVEIFLLALSLSADSFVVSMGGSVSLGRVTFGKAAKVGLVFGIVQAACLSAGWLSGYSIVNYISVVSRYVALVILSYLGISMIVSGVKGSPESADLSGFRHLLLASVATSIDAVAVGVSLAMGEMKLPQAALATFLTLAVTVLASSSGIVLGAASGRKFGNAAKVAGGIVLVFIGLRPFIF